MKKMFMAACLFLGMTAFAMAQQVKPAPGTPKKEVKKEAMVKPAATTAKEATNKKEAPVTKKHHKKKKTAGKEAKKN
jgi:hypothetical protein